MKRLVVTLVVCLLALPLFGRSQQSGWCSKGGQTVVMSGLGASTTTFVQTYPACTITVYLTGTSTLATLYNADGSGKSNPFVSDSNTGYWSFYADNGVYDVQASGTGVTSPFVIGTYTFSDTSALSSIVINGNTITASAGSATVTIPNSTDTLVNLASSQALTNKTYSGTVGALSGGTLTSTNIATKYLNAIRFADQFAGADGGAKIQAAIDDAPSGGTVYVPAGTYTVSSTITISKPITLLLDGAAIIQWTTTASATGIFNITSAGSGTAIKGLMGGYSQGLGQVPGSRIIPAPTTGPMDVFVIGDSTHETSGLLFEGLYIGGNTNVRDIFRYNGGGSGSTWRRVIAFGPFPTYTSGYFINFTLSGASSLENNAYVIDQCQAWWMAKGIHDATNWNAVRISSNRFQYMSGSALVFSTGVANTTIDDNDISQVNRTVVGGAISISGTPTNFTITGNHFEGNGGAGAGTSDISIAGTPQSWVISGNRFWGLSGAPKAIVITTTQGSGVIDGNGFDTQSIGAVDASAAGNTYISYRNNFFNGAGSEVVGSAVDFVTTLKGGLYVPNIESIRFADQFAGASVSAQLDAAAADCGGNRCSVVIPSTMGAGCPTTAPLTVTFYDHRGSSYSDSCIGFNFVVSGYLSPGLTDATFLTKKFCTGNSTLSCVSLYANQYINNADLSKVGGDGISGSVYLTGTNTNTAPWANGAELDATIRSQGGAVTTATGVVAGIWFDSNTSTTAVTNAVGVYGYGCHPVTAGAVAPTNCYGVYAQDQNQGTGKNYSIYAEGLSGFGKGIQLGSAAAPTCDATTRGTFWYVAGAAGVKDVVQVCGKDAANVYAWRAIY